MGEMTHARVLILDLIITREREREQWTLGILKVFTIGLCNSEGELPDDHRVSICIFVKYAVLK